MKKILFRDFAGQEIYYSTHVFFLTEKSIYLIVGNMFKIMEKGKELNRVLYWINTIKARVMNPEFIFVGTHLDSFEELLLDYDEFISFIEKETKINREYIIGISSQSGKNVDKLLELLKSKGLEMPMINEIFPKIYLDLKIKMEEVCKQKYPPILTWNELKEKAKECNIIKEQELLRATNFLHILGFCLHFQKEKVFFLF